jgi:hypothetical protein
MDRIKMEERKMLKCGWGIEQKKYLCSFLFVKSVSLHNVSILVKNILFFCNFVG